MGKVAVFGSANMDLVATVEHLPKPGETVLGTHFVTAFGGKGANEAVAAARLGAEVVLVACLGDDAFGARYLEHLKSEGINCNAVTMDPLKPTGCALIAVQVSHGENCIIVCPGANGSLTRQQVLAAKCHVVNSDIFLVQYEIPHESVLEVIGMANALARPVVFNFSPISRRVDLKDLVIDYLIVNEIETAILADMPVETDDAVATAARRLHDMNCRTIIVTRGSRPTFVSSAAGHFWTPVQPAKPVDTVGAGDTFAGAFATAISEGMDLRDAVDFGNRAASIAIMHIGAQTSMPKRAELEKFSQPSD